METLNKMNLIKKETLKITSNDIEWRKLTKSNENPLLLLWKSIGARIFGAELIFFQKF